MNDSGGAKQLCFTEPKSNNRQDFDGTISIEAMHYSCRVHTMWWHRLYAHVQEHCSSLAVDCKHWTSRYSTFVYSSISKARHLSLSSDFLLTNARMSRAMVDVASNRPLDVTVNIYQLNEFSANRFTLCIASSDDVYRSMLIMSVHTHTRKKRPHFPMHQQMNLLTDRTYVRCMWAYSFAICKAKVIGVFNRKFRWKLNDQMK